MAIIKNRLHHKLTLTPMQKRIVYMMIDGWKQTEIAIELGMRMPALYAHIWRAKSRLDLNTVHEMVGFVAVQRFKDSRKCR